MQFKPKLTLVGAGPGDPDLISVRGVRALADADVVLYDALVSKDLLQYVRSSARKICVGKRPGHHAFPQHKINRMIVSFAFTEGHVVRLKGGDPFIFGRGYEELKYAEAFGVETAVVPGISSATGIPALQKIPLTLRGTGESFWVVTGTTRTGAVSGDVILAAQSTATVVILMGMKKLEEIVQTFLHFRKASLPVAVIQNGSLPGEKTAFGTVETITGIVRDKKIGSPALILIGRVAGVRRQYAVTVPGTRYFTVTGRHS